MAKEIEIAFSSIRRHKSFRKLRMSERGGYMALVQACLIDGFDPLPTQKSVLQGLAGATPKQWLKCEKAIFDALNDTLGILKTAYYRAKEVKQEYISKGKKGAASTHAIQAQFKAKAHIFVSEPVTQPVILQPTKMQRYHPLDVDMQARTAAKNAESSVGRLTEKR